MKGFVLLGLVFIIFIILYGIIHFSEYFHEERRLIFLSISSVIWYALLTVYFILRNITFPDEFREVRAKVEEDGFSIIYNKLELNEIPSNVKEKYYNYKFEIDETNQFVYISDK